MASFLRLGIVFAPNSGESLLSWLSRLCAANGMSTAEFSSYIIGRDSREFAALATRDEHALALGCVTGTGAAAMLEMMHSCVDPKTTTFFGQTIPWSALERSKRRISPGRLAADRAPFLRAIWSVRAVSCDPTTGERLVSCCSCGQPLWWWNMNDFMECGACMQDIRSIPTARGTSDELEVSRFWASIYSFKTHRRIEARSTLDPAVRDCDPAVLLHVAEFLGTLDAPSMNRTIEKGTLILKGWPQSIRGLAVDRRGAVERAVYDLLSSNRRFSVSEAPQPAGARSGDRPFQNGPWKATEERMQPRAFLSSPHITKSVSGPQKSQLK